MLAKNVFSNSWYVLERYEGIIDAKDAWWTAAYVHDVLFIDSRVKNALENSWEEFLKRNNFDIG